VSRELRLCRGEWRECEHSRRAKGDEEPQAKSDGRGPRAEGSGGEKARPGSEDWDDWVDGDDDDWDWSFGFGSGLGIGCPFTAYGTT
jgi:hypothetical protein